MSLKEKSQAYSCWDCHEETSVEDATKSHNELGNITVKEYRRMFGIDNDESCIINIDGYKTVVLCEECLPKYVESVFRRQIEKKRNEYIETMEPRIRDYFSPFDLNRFIDNIFTNDSNLIEYFEFSFPIILDILEQQEVSELSYISFYVSSVKNTNTIHYDIHIPLSEKKIKGIKSKVITGMVKESMKKLENPYESPPIDIDIDSFVYPHTLLNVVKNVLNGNEMDIDDDVYQIVDYWISEVNEENKETSIKFMDIFSEIFAPKNIDGYNVYNLEFNAHDSIIYEGDKLFDILDRYDIERMLEQTTYAINEGGLEYLSWGSEMLKFISKYEGELGYVYRNND